MRAGAKAEACRLEAPENEAERVANAANCNAHPMHTKNAPSLEYVKEVEDDDDRDRDADQPGEDAAHGGAFRCMWHGNAGKLRAVPALRGRRGGGEADREVPCEWPVWDVRRIVRVAMRDISAGPTYSLRQQ